VDRAHQGQEAHEDGRDATVPENHVSALSDTIPVLIRMSGPDAHCTYVNAGWLAFTGRLLVEELGDGWAEGVFPEDHERCLITSRDAVARRVPLEMEYRLRRADGTFRWLLDRGAPSTPPTALSAST
jgi:PAS domain S-box-containing protein